MKANYIGAPAVFALEEACRTLNDAFGGPGFHGVYLVGSALERPDWRDVDLRMIIADEEFFKLFPNAQPDCFWEFDPRWLLMTVAISAHLSKLTGLPVDFQFQPQSWANSRHDKNRSAMGHRMSRRGA